MSSAPLDYLSTHTPRPRRRWPWRTLSIGAAVLLLALAAPSITTRQDESQIDAVTGSITWKTIWLFGITSGPSTDISPLELRLKTSGIAWTPSWQFLGSTGSNVYGRLRWCARGSTPAIYHLRLVLQPFAAASTDAELRDFVRIMQTGTPAQQQAAVDAAAEKALQTLSTRPTEP